VPGVPGGLPGGLPLMMMAGGCGGCPSMPGFVPVPNAGTGPGGLPGPPAAPPPPGAPAAPGMFPGLPMMGSLPPGLVLLNVRPQGGEAEKKRRIEPRRKDVWPVFVGNISFDTTEEEIRDLFGDIEGLVSWRLSIQKDGVSRGFGFAEFKTPEGALEGIKKVDGIEIKGRKLRLRWGENAPTTPEVDDFHRAPERFKTRPCYEAFKGLPCPRGDDCPYAHAQSEIRHPRDHEEKPELKPIDPKDMVVKVVIPIEKFEGDTPEAKRRAAYLAILGPGASNIRTIMKKASCRLQLRGAGAPGGAGPGAKEPLHIIVKPRGDEVVSQPQIEMVRRAVDDIIETGKLPEAQGVDIEKSTGSKAASKVVATKSQDSRRERADQDQD